MSFEGQGRKGKGRPFGKADISVPVSRSELQSTGMHASSQQRMEPLEAGTCPAACGSVALDDSGYRSTAYRWKGSDGYNSDSQLSLRQGKARVSKGRTTKTNRKDCLVG